MVEAPPRRGEARRIRVFHLSHHGMAVLVTAWWTTDMKTLFFQVCSLFKGMRRLGFAYPQPPSSPSSPKENPNHFPPLLS